MPRASMEQARAVLAARFGFPDFRSGQRDVIDAVLSGADTLAILPTGGGKSLCYQVPALVLDGLTVVISPLISLMQDQVERLAARGVSATFLNSTLDPTATAERLASVAAGRVKLLYLAPERFETRDVARSLRGRPLALLAVDEAHCISEWGHEFRPSFRKIADVAATVGAPQVVALTATATPAVRHDITRQLRLRTPRVIVGGFDRANLDYAVRQCDSDAAREECLVRLVGSRERPAIVYAPTRLAVERVAKRLTRAGVRTLAYHGGLHVDDRRDVQQSFMSGSVDTIAATNAFGMGIDKPDVRLVVHQAMPGTLEAYYQEAGRAGRDGAPAACVLLHHAGDRGTHEWFIRGSFPPRAVMDAVLRALTRLRDGDRVTRDAAVIARTAPGVSTGDVRAALGLLEREGYVRRPAPSSTVRVRLVAVPARIRRELHADTGHIGVLRALWRLGGDDVHRWQHVDLAALGQTSARAARRQLDALRQRQFVEWSECDARLIVADPECLDVNALDWPRFERRRATELRKLDWMQRYANTEACRRVFVLGYFGDRASVVRCAGCDNCRRKRSSH